MVPRISGVPGRSDEDLRRLRSVRFPFPRACSREDAREAVVPFMARILVYQLVALPHGQRHSPRPRPDCRVINRVLVEERVVVEAPESLDQVQVFVSAPSKAAQAHRTGTLAPEVLCLDDERVAV